MRLLLPVLRRRFQVLLAAVLVAAAAVVAGPAIAAHAQDCIGSSCNGLNSNAEGCVSDAVSRSAPETFFSTAAGEQLAIQLRGSPSCESRWARVWAINSSGSQLPPPLGLDFTIYSDNASGQVVYAQTATAGTRGWESYPYWVGPMVSGVGLYSRACIQNGGCTSWWPSSPPAANANCGRPVMFGLHGMAEGPSSTNSTVSPELLSFDTDQNAISGAVLIAPVSYPTVYPNQWHPLLTAARTALALFQGEGALQNDIEQYAKGCSADQDKIALVGYSLGAWIINKWIVDHPLEWDMIKAVVLYGDPCWVNGKDEGLAREIPHGYGCMPAADYPYPLPGTTTAVPFAVRSWTTRHDPVSGDGWGGKANAQLSAAEACAKNHCTHLDYTGSTEIYEGALFVVRQLVG